MTRETTDTRDTHDMDALQFTPIGTFSTPSKFRYETPRQGVLAAESAGIIRLRPQCNFEQALRDLHEFERLWIIYVFHLNGHWKPLVHPPRHRTGKVGVFATRAPFRPNPIGLSCVRLVRVDGLDVHVAGVDLLDGTPVLDIKPYIPYADAFPGAATGWVRNAVEESWALAFTTVADNQCDWIREQAGVNLRGFIRVQLTHDPRNRRRKRITVGAGFFTDSEEYRLAYRTWRVHYSIDETAGEVLILGVSSGYTSEEISKTDDPYADKESHRRFRAVWPRPAV